MRLRGGIPTYRVGVRSRSTRDARAPDPGVLLLLEMIATRSERKTAHITGESITGYFRERLAERARGEGDDAISTLAREAARGELINATEAAGARGIIGKG